MDVLRYFSLDLSAGLLMNNISLQVVLGCFFCSVQYSILIILFEDVASVSVNVYWLVVRCTFACVCVLFFFLFVYTSRSAGIYSFSALPEIELENKGECLATK